MHVEFVIQLVCEVETAILVPAKKLFRGAVAAHDVAIELEGRVFAGDIARTGCVTVNDAHAGCFEGLVRIDDRRTGVHFDLHRAIGIFFDKVGKPQQCLALQ